MKIQRIALGLGAIIGLGIAFLVGRYFQPTPHANHDHQIYVRSAGNGQCLVTYPVVVMSYSSDRVQWLSEDHQYSITFINIDPPPGSPPLPSGYVKESPLAPPTEPVTIDPSHPSKLFNVKHQVKYYYYAIFDKNYPNNPCKVSTDAQDPGLNVKE